MATDVINAKVLKINQKPLYIYQGQTHGHPGFLISRNKAKFFLDKHPEYSVVLRPYIVGEELITTNSMQPQRFVIDFMSMDIDQARAYKLVFAELEKVVYPWRKTMAEMQEFEKKRILQNDPDAKVPEDHINAYKNCS